MDGLIAATVQVELAKLAKALQDENTELRAALARMADAMEARLGTNASEWADVRKARALLERPN